MSARQLSGLYAITPETLVRGPADALLAAATATLRGGATLLQFRDKWNPRARQVEIAAQLLRLCRSHGATLIINDDPSLAAEIGAHGVHVGQQDSSVAEARRLLGATAIVGATCGNSIERARQAIEQGADYVAFGRMYASRTKPLAPPAELATLTAARTLGVPVCAIGGVEPQHAGELVSAGADLLAAIDGIFGSGDIESATRVYVQAIAAAQPRGDAD